jgi:hypothetical protein
VLITVRLLHLFGVTFVQAAIAGAGNMSVRFSSTDHIPAQVAAGKEWREQRKRKMHSR